MIDITTDSRFQGIVPFEKKVWLASPTMHGDEQHWVDDAIQTNWVSTVGANINEAVYGNSKADFIAKLHISLKETGESIYWLTLLKRTKLIDYGFDHLLSLAEEIKRILIASLKTAKGEKQ